MSTITQEEIKFDLGSPCISSAQKFIIPVPAFPDGGRPLIYPEGHPKVGESIVDWEGKPIGERGVIFRNKTDASWQAAQGDGNAVIIMNQVNEEQAKALDSYIRTTFRNWPGRDFTVDELEQLLEYARTELKLVDRYDSNTTFITN